MNTQTDELQAVAFQSARLSQIRNEKVVQRETAPPSGTSNKTDSFHEGHAKRIAEPHPVIDRALSLDTAKSGAICFTNGVEFLKSQHPNWLSVLNSHSWLAIVPAAVLMIPMTGFLLLVRHSMLGQMFLTNPLIGLSVLFLTLQAVMSLAIRAIAIWIERHANRTLQWPHDASFRIDIDSAESLIQQIRTNSASRSLLSVRLIDGLNYFRCGKTAAETKAYLDSQIDHDASKLHSSFATVNLICWTLPILGFIGTVWGLGDAIGPFAMIIQDTTEIDGIKSGLVGVIGGLATAFQTTFVSLVASVLVMFPRIATEKAAESTLLAIDQRCNRELISRLQDKIVVDRLEPEGLVNAFSELLQKAQNHWNRQTERVASLLAESLDDKFRSCVESFSEVQNRTIENFRDSFREATSSSMSTVKTLEGTIDRFSNVSSQVSAMLARLGQQADERLAQIGPSCEKLANSLSQLSGQHRTLLEAVTCEFSKIDAAFQSTHELMRISQEHFKETREVQLPETVQQALVHISQTMVPVAKIFKQQAVVQAELNEVLRVQTNKNAQIYNADLKTATPTTTWWYRLLFR